MLNISIIIPAYNRTHLLRETLVSCFTQTYQHYEVIVVDDGSEEDIGKNVEAVCKDFDASRFVKYVRQSHSGGSAARNRGLREAKGELIQFLDSDDLLHPDKLCIQREVFDKTPNLEMVFSLDQYFQNWPGDTHILWNVPSASSFLDMFLSNDPVFHTGSPLWRRSALERVGGWDERLLCWQDWEFHIRALCRGIRYTQLPIVLQFIRDHTQLRSTNLASLVDREKSKMQAASAVAGELKSTRLWNVERGDMLAMFLLSIGMNLGRAKEVALMESAVTKAGQYASNWKLQLTARLMLTAAQLSSRVGIRHSVALDLVHRITRKCWYVPERKSSWKTVPFMLADLPSTLLQALTRYRRPML